MRRKKHLGFYGLEHLVAREYMRKGYSRRKALDIGRRVAGKVRWEKERKKRRRA